MRQAMRMVALLAAMLIPAANAMATEQPAYEVLRKDGAFELRRYAPMIVAETWAEGGMDAATGSGFRALAEYIFGNKVAMTAPVAAEPQGPVLSMQADRWRMHFVMPRQYTLDTLPRPANPVVTLREIPAKTMAALAFPGTVKDAEAQLRTEELLAWVRGQGLAAAGTPQLARYNPPWTPPEARRNEILAEVVPRQ